MHEPPSHDSRWDETRQQVNKGDRSQKKKAKKETCHMPQAGSGSSRAAMRCYCKWGRPVLAMDGMGDSNNNNSESVG